MPWFITQFDAEVAEKNSYILSSVHVDILGGSEKVQNYADVIYG